MSQEIAICKIDSCSNRIAVKSLGLCSKHYARLRKYGDTSFVKRRKNGSGSIDKNGIVWLYKPDHPNTSKNGKMAEHVYVMTQHLGRPLKDHEFVEHKDSNNSNNSIDNLILRSGNDHCSVEGCYEPQRAKTLCEKHYKRKIVHGNAEISLINRFRPTGTGTITSSGYVAYQVTTKDGKRKRFWEHRMIMEDMLGRTLLPHETVHHKNGVRHDNRPENLELWTKKQPPGQRPDDKIQYAYEILELYESKENLVAFAKRILCQEN